MTRFKRGKVLSFLLLLLNFLQESDLVIKAGTNSSMNTDNYSSSIINALDYFMLRIDDPSNMLGSKTAHLLLFYFSLCFNSIIIIAMSLACLVFLHQEFSRETMRCLLTPLSAMIKCYNYATYLPFLSISVFIISHDDYSSILLLGYINTILTIALSIIIVV